MHKKVSNIKKTFLNDLTHREENVGEHRLKIQGRGPFGFEKFERRLRIHFFRVLLDFW